MGSLPQHVIGTGITGATAAGTAMAVVAAPYDFQGSIIPAVNSPAIITLPATPGKQWLLHSINTSILAAAAGSGQCAVIVVIGATQPFTQTLSTITTAGYYSDKLVAIGLAIIAPINTAMVITTGAAGAGIVSRLSVGAYLI